MNKFTKTEYDWSAAYTFVVNKLEEGELAMDKTIRELAGCFAVSKFSNDQAYGDTSDNQLATIFFDQAGGLISSRFENADNSEQERLMIKLMQIKFAMALIYGFDRADKAFIDWQDGEHDT
jgi:hypothetical protein